jgi:5'-phosphate synthase pdxT subunit
MNKHIGVLALQGDYQKHLDMLLGLGVEARLFRELEDIPRLAGLVIPGGESTTIGMLLERRGLDRALRTAILDGLPVFGTCAGAILLARDIEGSDQLRLGTMGMSIRRNAYGSQVDSFEITLELRDPDHRYGSEIDGVFIRAPRITAVDPGVTVLTQLDGYPVMVRQGRQLAASFHPELTASSMVHRYFAEQLCGFTTRG